MEILGVVDIPVWVALVVILAALLYKFSSWNHSYFIDRGIPGPKPYPFIGHNTGLAFLSKTTQWKKKHGDIFGIFLGQDPAYVISDLEVLKDVFVKSFSNFRDRRKFALTSSPFSLGLFFLEGEAWRRVRNILSPTFSSGKLRGMVPSINDCAKMLTNNFKKQDKSTNGVDMKEHFGAYTMDVIARTAFGIQVDSQNDFNDPFIAHAKKFLMPNSLASPMIVLLGVFPFLSSLILKMGVSFINEDIIKFFVGSIAEMIKQRRTQSSEEGQSRTDFLQLLIDAEVTDDAEGDVKLANRHSDANRHLSTDEIVGQGLIFFIAGYETTASTLNYATYSLAMNPDVQEKAYNEIMEVMGDKDPTYENIGALKYLENVIIETLRLYPPVPDLNRRAAEAIDLNGVKIEKGQTIFIPSFAIQRDPSVFPDPMAFNPDRHDGTVNPLSFLSFGYGPRICIGMRLALIEAKIALIHVLKTVKFSPMPDTPKHLRFKNQGLLIPVTTIKLKVTAR